MKTCFGYIRVSTEEQAEGASLDAQRDAIAGFASQNNLAITQWFEEHESASKAGRPVLEAMLQRLRNGEAEGLIIHKTDRFSRNYADWARIDEFAKSGVKIYVAAESVDFESVTGRFVADINMALAAHYSRNLSVEVKKGLHGRVNHGIWPFRAPIGYRDEGKGNLKSVDPIKAPLVKQAFKLYGTGEYSITSLTDEMARQGLTGHAGRPVVRRNIETMLRNPFYTGKLVMHGRLYDGGHTPLISAAQFQKVREIKAQKAQKKSNKHHRMYRALLHCADCGKILTGEAQKTHIYYRCHTPKCPSGSVREDRLETQIIAQLRQLSLQDCDKQELRTRLATWLGDTATGEMAKSIRLRISDAKARQDRLTDLLVDGTITEPDFHLRRKNNEFELQRLLQELDRIEKHEKSITDLDDLLEFASNLDVLFLCGTPQEKRLHLKNCATTLTVKNGTLNLKPKPWINDLQDMAIEPDGPPTPALIEKLHTASEASIPQPN